VDNKIKGRRRNLPFFFKLKVQREKKKLKEKMKEENNFRLLK